MSARLEKCPGPHPSVTAGAEMSVLLLQGAPEEQELSGSSVRLFDAGASFL